MEADGKKLCSKADENLAVRWFTLAEAVSMLGKVDIENIYAKLNAKLRIFREICCIIGANPRFTPNPATGNDLTPSLFREDRSYRWSARPSITGNFSNT